MVGLATIPTGAGRGEGDVVGALIVVLAVLGVGVWIASSAGCFLKGRVGLAVCGLVGPVVVGLLLLGPVLALAQAVSDERAASWVLFAYLAALFIPTVAAIMGTSRLARPASWWARRFYDSTSGANAASPFGAAPGPLKGRMTVRLAVPAVALILYLGLLTAKKVDQYASAPEDGRDCATIAKAVTAGADVDAVPQVWSVRDPPFSLVQRGGTINDASCLNPTGIYGVMRPTSEDDIRTALRFAADQDLKVSVAGVRHSMGGQAFFRRGLVLDMTDYDRMTIDDSRGVLTVQSGATWSEVLSFLHPRGYSVQAMQAVDILTIGGTVSVNAHGIDHRSGAIADSIRSLRVMLADGTVREVSREREAELFRLVVGGYGLFGIILDVDLELTDNRMYRYDHRIIDYREFAEIFSEEIAPDDGYRLMYGHLSTSPGSFLKEMIVNTYRDVDGLRGEIPPLKRDQYVAPVRFVLNLAKISTFGQRVKWMGEKHVLPRFRHCYASRNDALPADACLLSRNHALHVSLDALKHKLPNHTEVLQEYFVPQDRLISFLDAMRDVLKRKHVVLLNASVRVVHADDLALSYASDDMFGVVLYLSQAVTRHGNAEMAAVNRDLIDAAIDHGGTFYLPYQLNYSRAQLSAAYPNIGEFFDMKRQYDPSLRFMNQFYEKYADT
jgi:FAD/FMN-containing dehydrogenase